MSKRRIPMEKIREILRLCIKEKLSIREASRATGVSKTSIGEYIGEFKRSGLTYENSVPLSNSLLAEIFENKNKATNKKYEKLSENFEYYQKELKRPGVCLNLLWQEYKEQEPDGFSYSRFCHHFGMWSAKRVPSMHMDHKAGEKMFVDFAGKKFPLEDPETGEIKELEVFVAILASSQYTYIEACENQKKGTWIKLNENALHFFGGVPRVIVPDNLKSAVNKASKYEPLLNQTYEDFARHYDTVIIPARPIKPKDKALVENAVSLIYKRVYAPLRNTSFFYLDDVNEAFWEKLDNHNQTPFQRTPQTRKKLYEEIEKGELKPLPVEYYQLKEYEELKVQFNYHIYLKLDKHYYSVPWRVVGKKVRVIYTCSVVEIYLKHERIAFHKRNGKENGYSTEKEHMPPAHRYVAQWSPERFINWAAKIGDETKEFIKKLLGSKQHPEQAFRACMGVLAFAKKHENSIINKVCKKAIDIDCISYQFINNSLKNKTYLLDDADPAGEKKLPEHSNIRGKQAFQ